MRRPREASDGGPASVIALFDEGLQLPSYLPTLEEKDHYQPGALIPAFYDAWWRATGESYWKEAAVSARELLNRTFDPVTGLSPSRVYIDGRAVETFDIFRQDDYPIGFNMALDFEWSNTPDTREQAWCDTLLTFFADQQPTAAPNKYAKAYYYNTGIALDANDVTGALPALIGASASIATLDSRKKFIESVWNRELPVGADRYFDGITQLFALMLLSGNMVPYR